MLENNPIIPFNVPETNEKDLESLLDFAKNPNHFSKEFYSRSCQELLQKMTNTKQVLLTHSCTAALEMAAILIDLKPGDEVIMPSFTFVSTANAFVLRGAKPVFVDIHPNTLNINEALIESAITNKTKAIVPVHYAGVACNMDAIMEIANRYGLFVIEDAAQGICANYKNKSLGGIGHLGAMSFHHTKNITSGLGGALFINDDRFIERAKILWQKGTNRSAFLEGQVDKYTWVDVGSSFMLPELSAALLLKQLERAYSIINKRLDRWHTYFNALHALQELIQLPHIPLDCQQNAHIFYFLLKQAPARNSLLRQYRERGIEATFHYLPLHTSPMGAPFHDGKILPVSEKVSQSLIRLPLYSSMSDEQQNRVIDATLHLLGEKNGLSNKQAASAIGI